MFTTEFGVVDDVSSLDRQAAAVRHRIARIQRQIHEHLLDLAGIRFHASKRRRQHHRDLDLLADQPAQHLTRLLHHGIAVQQARFEHRFPAEQQQLTGQQCGPLTGITNGCQVVTQPIIDREAIDQRLGVAVDDGQEIVEIMRDSTRKLTDCLHLLGLAQLFFEPDAIGDVLCRSNELDGRGRYRIEHGLGLLVQDTFVPR